MLKDANFLCEIGTEEIPAGYIQSAINSMQKSFEKELKDNRIDFNSSAVYATPRRLVILISGLAEHQREEETEIKGPSVKAAYDDKGQPSKALQGFLKGNGLTIEDIESRETDKGGYIFAVKKLGALESRNILPGIIERTLSGMAFPKRMRWSDKDITFPRPIKYFLILFNGSVIPFEMDGIVSGDMTRGHFVQHDRMLRISSIEDYEKTLAENGVILDQEKRRELIKKELHAAAEKAGGMLYEDDDLLDTVTFLVENPVIVDCEFDPGFLNIPDIVLIAEMKEHQKYFAVVDEEGRLINRFLVTSNNPFTEYIREGNRRVITARFNDARFFYDEDRRVRLSERVPALKNVLFHKQLGSIFDKVQRMQTIASIISEKLGLEKKQAGFVSRAVDLCKTDLITAMVIEFPSLQGQVGRIYALNDGEDQSVADAINDHYKPRFHGDSFPENIVSVVVSLAEKIDNLFGSFSVGNIPRGSQDPYALRRQANALVELILRNELSISLKDLFENIADGYKDGGDIIPMMLEFISARARTIFSERGFSHDEIEACMSTGSSDYLEMFRRAGSVNEFRKNEKFSEMLLGFKRMNNIVSAFRKKNPDYVLSFDISLLEDQAEKDLHEFFESRMDRVREHISNSEYIQLFTLITDGKSIIDTFFDRVLVMDERTAVRDNRLYLLESILGQFSSLLDFSRIEDR